MQKKLQKLVFPSEAKHHQQRMLFYRGDQGYLDRENSKLSLGQYQYCDFTTYLNGCSLGKWKRYTNIQGLKLQLEVEGTFEIVLVGYHLDVYSPERSELLRKKFTIANRQIIELEYPENSDMIVGFEVYVETSCVIFGGYYIGGYVEEDMRHVRLSIATTTCRKEEFITKNIELLKKEIFEGEEEYRENIYLHVIDNGRTLNPKELESYHILVHPNKNTGGAGGFSRGMIESLHQSPEATHVLLMDDDVLILPESIKRTYIMLTLLKKEYQEHFISGAMLYYEEMNIQHEDIGTVCKDGEWRPLKPRLFHQNIQDNLMNEQDFLEREHQYAAWWYCCIPVTTIKDKGLPLPVFIRGDDTEYSLRAKAKFITLNGICIWHMGFTNKYSAALDRYQQCRNRMLGKAISGVYENIDILDNVKKAFRIELLRFNYDAAELVVKALEDYMKGPEFLMQDLGEKIFKENLAKNEKMVSLNEFKSLEINLNDVYWDPPRKFIDKWLLRFTYNGHRFWPSAWLKKEPTIIAFDYQYQPQKIAMRRSVIAVNPHLKVGIMRSINKNRYRELQKRYKKVMQDYKVNGDKILNSYRKKADYLISEEFWLQYLEISN